MKTLVFDSGPIINLAMNNILWLLEPLKKKFNGKFVIGQRVKEELIDYPLEKTKKFKFEALQTLKLVDNDILSIYPTKDFDMDNTLFNLLNSLFIVKGKPFSVVHGGEVEAVAIAISTDSTVVIDERTMRLMIENPKLMARLLERKLNSKVRIDNKVLKQVQSLTKNLKIIRSIELVTYAYEQGLLDVYVPSTLPKPRRTLLESVLWGIKLRGCSITIKEIDEIQELESRRK